MEQANLVIEVLKQIKEMFGPAAETVWRIAMRQVYVNAFNHLAAGLLILCFSQLLLRQVREWLRLAEKDSLGTLNLYTFLASVLVIFSMIVGASFCIDAIGYLLNPEWFTIRLLLDLVR